MKEKKTHNDGNELKHMEKNVSPHDSQNNVEERKKSSL